MNLLALETSSNACSVALQNEAGIVERHETMPRQHTRLLLPMLREIVEKSGTAIGELDAIVLGNGPGSFIGTRIAASVAQGLAYAARLPVVPVSSLAAIAVDVFQSCDAREVIVTQDARMGEVYLGVYMRSNDGLPVPRIAECLHGQGAITAIDQNGRNSRVAAGHGWRRYPELASANRDRFAEFIEIVYPHARSLFALGLIALENGETVAPNDIEPAYLRKKVAQAAS